MNKVMDWHDYFFGLAKMVSVRSTCPSRKVGAVIINPENNFILATGYNGAPRGTAHCDAECGSRESGKDWIKCKAIHGELNAIVSAANAGVSVDGAHMYLTTTPCVFCSRIIINAGIKHVYAMSYYSHSDAIDLLAEGGVKVTVFSGVPTPTINYREENEVQSSSS
jgi:dCMP deaminase